VISLRRKPAPRNPPSYSVILELWVSRAIDVRWVIGSCARNAGPYDRGDIGLAGDSLPIVFTGRRRNKLIVLAFGIVLMGIGIMMIFDQGGSLVGGAGPFRRGVRPSEVGWMVCGLGLVLAVVALLQLARDCPRLELNDKGILYNRCLQTTRIGWSELDRAEIQRVSAARPIEAALDSLMLVTTDGRKVVISAPIAPAQVAQLRETITRVATRARSMCPVR
jgi:hypothetical protein